MVGPATSFNKKKYNKDGTEATRSIREDIGKALEEFMDDEKSINKTGAIIGGVLGARLTGGKFGKAKRTFKDFDLNVGARVLGGGTGGALGAIGSEIARQKMGGMPAGKKRRK